MKFEHSLLLLPLDFKKKARICGLFFEFKYVCGSSNYF